MGDHFYDCKQVELSSKQHDALQAAARRADIDRVDLHSLSVCRQRGDRTLFASWIVARDETADGARHREDVHCSQHPKERTDWTCHSTHVRFIVMHPPPDTAPFTTVEIPADMPVGEARELAARGLERAPRLITSDVCVSTPRDESDLKFFRKEIAKPGSWTLEAPDSTGKIRLIRDPYFVDFEGTDQLGAWPQRACWGVQEYLE